MIRRPEKDSHDVIHATISGPNPVFRRDLECGGGRLLHADETYRPINGKDLTGWKHDDVERPNRWAVGTARVDEKNPTRMHAEAGGTELVVPDGEKSTCLYTERNFSDVHVIVEAMIPTASNGGIFLMGEYEVQIADDTGNSKSKPGLMDFGAISRVHPPKMQAMNPAGQWQKFEITFRAPRFDAEGKKTQNAVFEKVILNGKVIHENAEVSESGYGCLTGEEHPTGPLYLQGNEGPVAYRNIVITPLK